MTRYFCDQCGKEIPGAEDRRLLTASTMQW